MNNYSMITSVPKKKPQEARALVENYSSIFIYFVAPFFGHSHKLILFKPQNQNYLSLMFQLVEGEVFHEIFFPILSR